MMHSCHKDDPCLVQLLVGSDGAINKCEDISACVYMPMTETQAQFLPSTDLFDGTGFVYSFQLILII